MATFFYTTRLNVGAWDDEHNEIDLHSHLSSYRIVKNVLISNLLWMGPAVRGHEDQEQAFPSTLSIVGQYSYDDAGAI